MYTVIPSFFPLFKSTVEIIFLYAVEYRLWFPLDFRHCFKTSSLQFHFQFGKQVKSQGAKTSELGDWGTITMLLLVTNSVVSRDAWAGALSCEGASCGCTKFLVFFVTHSLSSISKRHSKSHSWL
jgi:hypothetical protein